ncbi:adenosylcobinamide kinase /adenosylcobinamide-phosphate guanylyltransferase [Shimia gijangensis]|uniref:Bifunctional adenosylcobalamin biosynthesis protein n=1 Tax=Shimia gijangensis TaxID=1470563 RepID=A0A1M6FRV3_9RHOB|nr:bifunctional adenosylcobinamide kinase/adenosylcobinamide-phosphate guanylyltransferase [Shimia gijangensis]SHJ00458.1 adenosylcobinamide kinase /adenosylcobinamide-phosphate guanylyltransferase [Shimia gijangensis]
MILKSTFILGGASSGKSAFAEAMVKATNAPRVYIATSQAYDKEMQAKIASHRKSRGKGWRTIECPLGVSEALSDVAEGEVVLLDCATMWLNNQMFANNDIAQETENLLAAMAACKGRVVTVSNEVGMGIVPENALARQFRDAQGKLNQKLADAADLSVFVVAGLPLVLKGTLP